MRSTFLVIAVLVVAAVAYLLLRTPQETSSPRDATTAEPARESAPIGPTAVAPDRGAVAPVEEEPTPDPPEDLRVIEERMVRGHLAPEPDLGDPGTLLARVVDADSGADLERVQLRLQSEARFVDRELSSPIELRLTDGDYLGVVRRAGFDPHELTPFSISSGRPTDLGTVALTRGRAVIEGRLVSSARPTDDYDIELYGDGRGPCPSCPAEEEEEPQPCPTCGFARELTVREITGDPRFRFDRLAAGEYRVAVRARDDRTVARFVEVELSAGEVRWIDLEVAGEGVLDIALVDSAGDPFDGYWVEKGRTLEAPVRFYFGSGTVHVAEAEIQSVLAGLATAPEDEPAATSATDDDPDELERHDVRRRVEHSLWPPLFARTFEVANLPATRVESGLYRVRGLPPEADQVIASCGPFFSEILRLPDDRVDGDRVEVRLYDRCGALSSMLASLGQVPDQPLISCAACHQTPSPTRFGG